MNRVCILAIAIFVCELVINQNEAAKVYSKNARANIKSALNETKKSSNTTNRSDRSYLNPFLLTSAPSDCDLTPNYCDLHCCSDKDCSSSQKEAFNCDLEAEPSASKSNFWSCKERTSLSSLHAFLCYITDNSPFLGRHFLPPPDHLTDNSKFSKLTENLYQFPSEHKSDPETDPTSYQFGSRLKILPTNRSEGHLSLPGTIRGTNFCSRDKPIRFLRDRKTKCLQELNAESCGMHPISAEKFLEQTISKTGRSLEGANTTVNLLCLGNKEASKKFVRILKRDAKKIDYFSNDDIQVEFANCTETMFLNSFFDPRTSICYNALLSADYQITWNGTNITQVNSTFRFADIHVLQWRRNAPKFYLSQQFSVSFGHLENVLNVSNETNGSENVTLDNTLMKKKRSGNPGYLDGSPLIVGNLINSTSDSGNETFEWDDGYLHLLLSDSDGDCARTVPATFGYDTFTACNFKLKNEEISNCTLLSETMADVISSLVLGEEAAKRGDLKFESQADVVPVLWSGVDNNSSEKGGGCLVATGVSIKVLFSQHLLPAAGVKLSRLVGVRIDPLVLNLSLPAPSQLLVTTSLKFLRVDSVTERSKFWVRMMEHSENSWLEIFDPLILIFKNEDNMQEIVIFWSFFVATAVLIYANTKMGNKK